MDKPKLEFICTQPGVEEVMPIIRASEYKHSWIKKAVQDMKTNGSISAPHRRDYEAPSRKDNEERHTAKCPSLQMVQNTGWIMRLHQDVKIQTIGNGEDIKFDVPFQSQGEPIVSKHMTHAFYPFFENWPKDTMQKIIKIIILLIFFERFNLLIKKETSEYSPTFCRTFPLNLLDPTRACIIAIVFFISYIISITLDL